MSSSQKWLSYLAVTDSLLRISAKTKESIRMKHKLSSYSQMWLLQDRTIAGCVIQGNLLHCILIFEANLNYPDHQSSCHIPPFLHKPFPSIDIGFPFLTVLGGQLATRLTSSQNFVSSPPTSLWRTSQQASPALFLFEQCMVNGLIPSREKHNRPFSPFQSQVVLRE